jgi:general stress protein 26
VRDVKKAVADLVERASASFVGSIDSEGNPNVKAMLPPRKVVDGKVFFFTTNTSSMRVGQYRSNAHACVYFYDGRFFRGVMLLGTMEVLVDSQSKEMIWRDSDTLYYQLGVTDPDYCVLKFTAETGRFYSDFKSENFTVP